MSSNRYCGCCVVSALKVISIGSSEQSDSGQLVAAAQFYWLLAFFDVPHMTVHVITLKFITALEQEIKLRDAIE